ncbi:AAA family ATPase [Aeromonas veronii]|uniref:AAA family ATPase n=1 Tax=Aeromonas veronii TaxID=654 RepID=UPI003D240C99
MLLNFSVENFKSLRERANLDLTPSDAIRINRSHISKDSSGAKALRGGIICGSNAAGKSNVIKAISYAWQRALNNPIKDGLNVPQFKYFENSDIHNSRFEFEFSNNGKIYAYGFLLSRKSIIEEWLYLLEKNDSEHEIFTRKITDEKASISFGEFVKLNKDEVELLSLVNKTVPKNKFFLYHSHTLDISEKILKHIKNVADWLENKLVVIYPDSTYLSFETDVIENPLARSFYLGVLKAFDTGITDIGITKWELDELPEAVSKKILTYIEKVEIESTMLININGSRYRIKVDDDKNIKDIHEMVFMSDQKPFKVSELSDGTKRLMDIVPAIYSAINEDISFFIDEIDRSLHSLVTKALMEIFFDKDLSVKGQVVVTTHETSLVDQNIMRRDAIWLVQKEHDFSTILYPLTEYKIRHDKKISSDYLDGLFGGVISYSHAVKKIKGLL